MPMLPCLRRSRVPILALLALCMACAQAAPALAPAQQAALERAVADYEAGRLGEARVALQALARQQVPAAQYDLAVMHLRGEMPRPSRRQAAQLLLAAAQGGFVTAQFMWAQSLENGEFGSRDLVAAHEWYERAASAGSVPAQLAMGTAYYLGRGRPQDAARAAHWYRQAALGGDEGAMYLLASMYEQGDGVAQDRRLARHWYAQAADQGDVAARAKLAAWDQQAEDAPGPTAAPPTATTTARP